jgi:hypothetical protein
MSEPLTVLTSGQLVSLLLELAKELTFYIDEEDQEIFNANECSDSEEILTLVTAVVGILSEREP